MYIIMGLKGLNNNVKGLNNNPFIIRSTWIDLSISFIFFIYQHYNDIHRVNEICYRLI